MFLIEQNAWKILPVLAQRVKQLQTCFFFVIEYFTSYLYIYNLVGSFIWSFWIIFPSTSLLPSFVFLLVYSCCTPCVIEPTRPFDLITKEEFSSWQQNSLRMESIGINKRKGKPLTATRIFVVNLCWPVSVLFYSSRISSETQEFISTSPLI